MKPVFTLLPDCDNQVTNIVSAPDGSFFVEWTFVPALMTPEQRADFAAHCAEIEAYAAHCARYELEPFDEPPLRFERFEDALAYAVAVNWGHAIGAELDAYGAPAECAPLAYAAQERAYEMAVSRAI